MYDLGPACSIEFGHPSPDEDKRSDQEEAVLNYLETLRRNGQISSEEVCSVVNGVTTAFVNVLAQDAWSDAWDTRYTKAALDKVTELFERAPQWKVLGQEQPAEAQWEKEKWLFLYGRGDPIGCLRAGDSWEYIPLYTIPMDPDRKERLIFWARNMERLNKLWFAGVLEMDAWRERADPRSQTAEWGRELAREVEAATGRPVYYYLDRYYGFPPEVEQQRRCPGCGAQWNMIPENSDCRIHFQCVPCRLISQRGPNDTDSPAEEIGYPPEFLPGQDKDEDTEC